MAESVLERTARFEAAPDNRRISRLRYRYTCACCGYPYLYWDVDFHDYCELCGWNPLCGEEPDDADQWIADNGSLDLLTLAQARVNFEATGICYPSEDQRWPELAQRAKIRSAVMALLEDMLTAPEEALSRLKTVTWRLFDGIYISMLTRPPDRPPLR